MQPFCPVKIVRKPLLKAQSIAAAVVFKPCCLAAKVLFKISGVVIIKIYPVRIKHEVIARSCAPHHIVSLYGAGYDFSAVAAAIGFYIA